MKKLLLSVFTLITIVSNAQVWYEINPKGDTVYKWFSPVTTQIYVQDSVIKPYVPPVVVQPAPTPVNYLYNITWEQPDALTKGGTSGYGYWPNSIENPGTGIKPAIIIDPTNSGNRVLKIGVNANNKDGTRIRSEMTAWNLTGGLRQKSTYSMRIYIPADFKTDQNSNNFIQFHNAGKPGMIPNISFMMKGKQLDLNLAWATNVNATTHTDVHYWFDVSNWFGRWITLKMEVNWFPDATGYFRLYVDGKPFSNGKDFLGEHKGPMGYAFDTMGPYIKWGLHYPGGVLPSGSTSTSQYVLYDDITIVNK